jgi:Uma2 family endonuclease
MSIATEAPTNSAIIYPESDGQPMADNTLQFRWIVTIQGNLAALYADRPDVFVAGDLLWYPVEGHPEIARAPDVLVAFGRPQGERGSYCQWIEGGIAPQVVFEVLSPSNSLGEMARKLAFYDQYGVEEYYLYDPDRVDLAGWVRGEGSLQPLEQPDRWVSPRLGIRFMLQAGADLLISGPDGEPFLSFTELQQRRQIAEQRLEQAEQRLGQAEQRLGQAEQRLGQAEQARQEAERRANELAKQLRALGIDPSA